MRRNMYVLAVAAMLVTSAAWLPANVQAVPNNSPHLQIINARDFAQPLQVTTELSVRYQGKAVVKLELWVNEVLFAEKPLDLPQERGVASFSLDPAYLSAGKHTITVKAIEADGTVGMARTSVTVEAPTLTNLPLAIVSPANGSAVSGKVEIALRVSERLGRAYVSLFIDRQFKTLRNFPPYTYVWDTTTVENGWHLIEALGVDEARNTYRAAPVRVLVNNPGGQTMRETRLPEASTTAPDILLTPLGSTLSLKSAEAVPHSVVREAIPPVALPEQTTPPISAEARPSTTRPLAETSPQQVARVATPPAVREAPTLPEPRVSLPAPAATTVGTIARPEAILPPAMPAGQKLVVPPAMAMRPPSAQSTYEVRKGDTLTGIAKRHGVSPEALATVNGIANPHRVRAGDRLVIPSSTFQVVFDSTRIVFDVPPRVQDGIPLAPFRQIFEHTGGWLYWYPQSRTVRAVNAEREIELRIGQPSAQVNNQVIPMEVAPFIDRGRTIVPLSFVRDALDVKIHYDPKTGNLLIESER
ncbi:MAG: stalk domain-containing protein [Armatimonadota bacterium]|nr:stalk domain-containing protein [Armatimonadota bacterium]